MKEPMPRLGGTRRGMLLRAALRTLAIASTPAVLQAQDVISVNFTDSAAGSAVDTGTPGALPVAASNWTNANSTAGDGTVSDLIDDTGAPTSAAITWSSANTWRAGHTPTTGNGQLTKGYLDDGSGGCLITVSNIPFLQWNAYAIVGTDQGGATQTDTASYRPVTVNGTAYTWDGSATVAGGANWQGQNWTEAATLTEGLNYLRIADQGGLTAVIRGGTNSGGRGPIAGVQIENAYSGAMLYWDLNDTGAGSGSATPSGTWDDATANWGPDADGTGTAGVWPGAGNAAIFSAGGDATGSFTVTVSGTQTTDAVLLEEGTLALTGGTLSLASPAILRAGGGGMTIDATLDGSDGMVLEGGSNISLSGSHTISGPVVATVPSLNLASGTALPNLGALTVADGTTLIADASTVGLTGGIGFGNGSSLLSSGATFSAVGQTNLTGSSLTASGASSITTDSLFSNNGTAASSVTVNGTSEIHCVGDGVDSQGQFQQNSGLVDLSDSAMISTDRYVNRGGGLAHTLNISGSAEINVTDDLVFGDNSNASITINQTGGAVNNPGTTNNPGGNDMSNRWGHWGGGNTVYNLSAGELNLTGAPLYLSWDGPAELNISGTGAADLAGIDMGFGTRVNASTINLTGGSLTIGAFGIVTGGTTNKTINLGAGTLGASASWSSPLPMNITDAHTIDTGGFDIQLDGDLAGAGGILKTGAGSLGLGGLVSAAGGVTVDGGRLHIGGDLSNGVVVNPGASVGAGGTSTIGAGSVDTLDLGNGSSSLFRVGLDSDLVTVTGTDGLTTDTAHTIDIAGSFGLEAGVYPLIAYTGSIGGSGFGAFSLGTIPHITATLVDNTGAGTVDLDISDVDTLIWTGDNGSDWDLNSAVNWFLENGMANAPYFQSDLVFFDDTATTGAVNVIGTITPGDVVVSNDALDYTFSGEGLGGSTDFFKEGSGKVTLLNENTYTGQTLVDGGTLQIGDGTSGSIAASSRVEIAEGAEVIVIPSVDGNIGNTVLNAGTLRLGGSTDNGFGGTFESGSIGDIIVDSTGTTSFTTGKVDWTGDLTVNNGSVRTIGFGASSLGFGDQTRTLTFEPGTTLLMDQNNIFGGGGTDLALVPKIVLNEATLDSTRYNLLGDVDLNGATITGTPTDGPGNYEGYEMRGTYTVGGTAPSTIEIQNDRQYHVDAATTTFDVADVTGDAASDLLVSAPLKDASPDNGSVLGGFTKSGAGTMELTGASTYTGTTTVQAGTLSITGDGSSASSLLLVGAGATLDVSGNNVAPFPIAAGQTVGGNGTVNGGIDVAGNVAPGASAGALAVSGAVTFGPASVYDWEVADWTGTAGTGYDTLTADSIDFTSTDVEPFVVVVAEDALANFSEGTTSFVIASTTSGITGFDPAAVVVDDFGFTSGTGTWLLSVSGNDLVLEYTAGADPYAAYETANNIAGAGADIDSDGDGIDNGIEFVVGGVSDPGVGQNDADKLPTSTLDATYLNVTFRRTDDSAGSGPYVEYGSDLTGWTEAQAGVDGVLIEETDDIEPGIDSVTVRIPRALAVDNRIFARLRVDIP